MAQMVLYSVKLPARVKAGIPVAAKRHDMTPPEFVRLIMTKIINDEITIKLHQENNHHEQPSPAAD